MARYAARFILCAALACLSAPQAVAQSTEQPKQPSLGVVVVDKERILRESAVARRLAAQERAARAALQEEWAGLRGEIETEEAEIASLRESLPKEDFDARVRAFNDKVHQTQRTMQQKNEEIQRQFVNARRKLSEALAPVLFQIMEVENAALVVDKRSVLAARSGADMTAAAIGRFDEATAGMFLTPAPRAPEE